MRKITIGMAALLIIAACGEGNTNTSITDDTNPTSSDNVASTSVTGTDVTEPDNQPRTLDDYLGYNRDDPEAQAAVDADNLRKITELTARCMAEEGFEYVPAIPPDRVSGYIDLDQEEYVREEGFGVTTWYGQEPTGEDENVWVDPNVIIVDALPEAEQEAYQIALWGDPADQGSVDPETGETVPSSPFGTGCAGRSAQEVYGKLQKVWDQVGPMLDVMYENLESDSRYIAAEAGWVECMADRGYKYATRDDMYEEVYDEFSSRLNDLTGALWSVDPFEGWDEDQKEEFLNSKSKQEIEDFYAQAETEARNNVDQEAIAALQQEEIDLAVADYECHEALREVYDKLLIEYESRFVTANRSLLEEIET